MSDWTNLEDIMQDLSLAQGCMVPASLELFGNDGPPAYHVEEEAEHSQNESVVTAGGDAGPDCGLIRAMIKMVEKNNDSQERDSIAELEPVTQECLPQRTKNINMRNVAITSIIMAKEAELSAKRPIPYDVIPKMFKRKSTNRAEVGKEMSKEECPVSPPRIQSQNVNHYTPTKKANEYYSKYLMKNKLKEQFEDDIWSKVEHQMKEIDARRKRAAQLSPQDRGFYAVNLDQHRHQLYEDCIVCIVASKHGYNF